MFLADWILLIETEADLGQVIQWYQQSAKANNVMAQNYLGVCYENGTGVEKNIWKVVELYQEAAEHGSAAAQYKRVKKNIQKAVELYQKAAEQGFSYGTK